jgi:hypothetical protein
MGSVSGAHEENNRIKSRTNRFNLTLPIRRYCGKGFTKKHRREVRLHTQESALLDDGFRRRSLLAKKMDACAEVDFDNYRAKYFLWQLNISLNGMLSAPFGVNEVSGGKTERYCLTLNFQIDCLVKWKYFGQNSFHTRHDLIMFQKRHQF